LLLIQTALGEDRLSQAEALIEGSYQFSPDNLLTDVFKSLTLLYGGEMTAAEELIARTALGHPQAIFSQEVQVYIKKQVASFPVVKVLRVDNL
jgi:hypothetical protein